MSDIDIIGLFGFTLLVVFIWDTWRVRKYLDE